MPRILAIDWDRLEVRAVLLSSGPTGTSVAGAWVAPIESSDGTSPTGKQIGQRLADAMADQSLNKVTTIIGVGRESVQLKLLSLPPAPPNELADMVRFQAEREFTALGEDAALDFVPLSGDAETPHQVLAVALGPAGMAEAREICQAIGVEPDRVTLRASAAAALVARSNVVPSGSVALVVNSLNDEADFTVLADHQLVLTRTVRLPDTTQDDARQRTLLIEIRRTLAAVRQQLGDRQVDQVLICGIASGHPQVEEMASELDMRVTQFNPTEHCPSGLNRHEVPDESLLRFAAVLGMATGEADRRPPIVDFLNVRKRVVERRFTRTHVIAGAGAVAAVLMAGFYLWNQGAALDRRLAEIRRQIGERKQSVELAEKVLKEADAIDRWLATDVTWLDTLDLLSKRMRPEAMNSKDFPVDTDVVAAQLTMFRPPHNEAAVGRIDLKLKGKSAASMEALEKRVRDSRHQVSTSGWQSDRSLAGYEGAFDLNVSIMPPSEEAAP